MQTGRLHFEKGYVKKISTILKIFLLTDWTYRNIRSVRDNEKNWTKHEYISILFCWANNNFKERYRKGEWQMLNPNLDAILDGKARYSLVIATAKRAREISDEALEKGDIITEKPVTLALDEFIQGQRVIETK